MFKLKGSYATFNKDAQPEGSETGTSTETTTTTEAS